uniref:Uncharacterized protein n=1 Tax=Anguilla anguilla TaxID=7936 RepID=A0A0E9WS97_ANGAN
MGNAVLTHLTRTHAHARTFSHTDTVQASETPKDFKSSEVCCFRDTIQLHKHVTHGKLTCT